MKLALTIACASGLFMFAAGSTMLTAPADAAALSQCKDDKYSDVVDCCERLRKRQFYKLNYEPINCNRDVECKVTGGKKTCYIDVTLRDDDNDKPGGDTPGGGGGGDTPGGDTPGGDTPGGDTPGGDTPGGDTPGGDTPGGDTPGGGGDDTRGGNTPA